MSDALWGVLVGAFLTGTLTLLRDWISGRHADRREDQRMAHERVERRHADRKAAYSAFLSVTQSRLRGIDRFIEKEGVGPATVFGVGPMPEAIEDGLAEVALVAPDDTSEAARAHASALWDLECLGTSRGEVIKTRDTFTALAHRDLRGAS